MGLFVQRPKGAYAPVSQAFPIGAVFISVVNTNPNTLLGYGTWAAFGAGRVLVGLDSGDTDFDVAEETGGAKTVQSTGSVAAPSDHSAHIHSGSTDHTAHTHTGPSHQHNLSGGSATAHGHTYTGVINHTHTIVDVRGATTGTATTNSSGLTAGQDTSSTAVSIPVPNPSGGAASGTTADNSTGVTDLAGTGATGNPNAALSHGNTGNPTATLTHNAPAYTGNATSVVQPYIVVYMWKRTA